jgi:deoxycytidylate deaminase
VASSQRQQITAVIYDRRGRVLSVGQNSYHKTHTLQAHHAKKVGEPEKIYLHAEVAAIVRCPDLTKAYRIFVSRWDRQGRSQLAAPCAVCRSAIEAAGIRMVEHT